MKNPLVLVVEADEKSAELLVVAIERAKPGIPVVVQPDCAAAARLVQRGECPASPEIALLGPHAAENARDEDVAALRRFLGDSVPLIALSVTDAAPAGMDEVLPHPLEWRALSRTVDSLLKKWLK